MISRNTRNGTRSRKVARRDAGRPRGESVLDTVLACVLDELAVYGLEGLSVDRVAKAAEVNKTSVYRRWPTREVLVAAALERAHDNIVGSLVASDSLRDDLKAVGMSVIELLAEPAGRALAQAAFSESAAPHIAALAARRLNKPAEVIGSIVANAKLRGEWNARFEPETVLSTLVGAIMHRIFLEHQRATADWLATIVDMLLLGVAPR